MPEPEPPDAAADRLADLALLRDAAEAAGEIAMRRFRNQLESWEKGGGHGPVSEVDLEIDRMLKAELLAARPDYGWLSEESEDDPARLTRERVFIVDPIDGTRAFIAGKTTFAHSLAVAERGVVIAAAVHLPARPLSFEATLGGGATLDGAPIAASGRTALEGAAALTGMPQLDPALWPGGPPPVERHFRASLAYRLCLVGSGRFDAMITLRPAWEWDVAAGDLIAREAGALVTDQANAAARYNAPAPRLPGMIAAAPGLHAAIMARLA